METTDDYEISQGSINKEKVHEILVERHDFSAERINSALDKLLKAKQKKQQKGLVEWI